MCFWSSVNPPDIPLTKHPDVRLRQPILVAHAPKGRSMTGQHRIDPPAAMGNRRAPPPKPPGSKPGHKCEKPGHKPLLQPHPSFPPSPEISNAVASDLAAFSTLNRARKHSRARNFIRSQSGRGVCNHRPIRFIVPFKLSASTNPAPSLQISRQLFTWSLISTGTPHAMASPTEIPKFS